MKGIARMGPAAVFFGFGTLLLAHAAGEAVPPTAAAIAALLAFVVALGLAGTMLVRIWRGPPLATFRMKEVAFCDPSQAEVIRAAAQVRGTLGGAGHVHRVRLVLPAVACAATAVFAAGFLLSGGEAPVWPIGVLVPSAGVSMLWRARPFQYREATGGWIVVHPAAAQGWLLGASANGRVHGEVVTDGGSAHPG